MRNAIEVAFHVRVINRAAALREVLPHYRQRAVCTPPGSEPVGAFQEVRFKDRFQDQKHRCLDHPVPEVRDAQRPQLPVRFGDIHPPHRSDAVGLFPQLSGQLFKKGFLTFSLDLLDRDPVHSRFAAVGPNLRPCRQQRLGVAHQPIKALEAIPLLLFGFRAQLRSPFPEFRRQSGFPHGQLDPGLFCRRLDFHLPNQPRFSLSPLRSCQGPFAPRALPRFHATMASPTPLPPAHALWIWRTPRPAPRGTGGKDIPACPTQPSLRAAPTHPGEPRCCP